MSSKSARAQALLRADVLPPARIAAPTAVPLLPAAHGVLLLVFGSGFCALAYQIAWQREFRGIFGASTAASAAVLAVFMGGLGLGALVLGPRADRHRNPLAFYAALEALVAVTAAATPLLVDLTRRVYLGVGGADALGAWGGGAVRLLLATLVLLPPTFVAGGTLGAAARAVESEGDRRRRATALLYGLNTLGAVAGALAASFWALEALGTRPTLWAATVLNLAVAAAAYALSRGRAAAVEPASQAGVDREPAAPPPFVLVAAALVGFAFFLMELVWYRMLGPILGGTVYTFGLVLATALLGIGLGGVLYVRFFARAPVGLSALAATCLAQAGCLALPYALGDRLALAALAWRPEAGAGLSSYLVGWSLVTAIVVLPASLVAGFQFPLLVALLGAGRRRLASHIGRAYSSNTAGGIAGALAGGFGLLPLLSAPGCWRASALMLCSLALVALALDRRRARFATLAVPAASALVAAALLAAPGPTAAWRHSGIGAGRSGGPAPDGANATRAWLHDARRSIVWEREGVESSVALQAVAAYSFLLNGKADGNARNDAPTQVMGGLLGPLLRPGARRALVIGLGTGSTAGWLAAVPGMERTDVIELEPAVMEVARVCAPVNRAVLSNPAVTIRIGDARETLMTTRGRRWDVVFSEPSNPYRAGIAGLFTREFYEAVEARLSPDGLFLQWLQAYEVDERTVSTVLATMAAVFPAVEVWQVHHIDLVLIGSRQPLRHDAEALRSRMAQEPFASALRHTWRATDLHDVLARFVAGPALARGLRDGGHEINTDDRNPVEFAFARTASRSGLFDVPRLRRQAAAAGADRLDTPLDWDKVVRRRLDVYTLAGYPPPVKHDASGEERARQRAHAEYAAGRLASAAESFGAATPESLVETMLLAEGLADAGDPAARPHIEALYRVQPTEAEAATARLALRLGLHELARDALVASFVHYRADPWPSQISMAHALGLAVELASAQPAVAPPLAEALSKPFAVAALEEPRRLVRMQLVSLEPLTERCRDALADMEPHVPWRADVLEFRSRCYAATRDPRASEAAADLASFRGGT